MLVWVAVLAFLTAVCSCEQPRSLGIFYLAVIFAESSANSFTVVSVIYLVDYIEMSSTEVILFFLVALIGFLPGTQLGAFVTHRTNPKNSWRMGLFVMFVVTVAGALGLQPGMKIITFVWGFLIGITLGWHYPTVSNVDNGIVGILLNLSHIRKDSYSPFVCRKGKTAS